MLCAMPCLGPRRMSISLEEQDTNFMLRLTRLDTDSGRTILAKPSTLLSMRDLSPVQSTLPSGLQDQSCQEATEVVALALVSAPD